MSEEVATADANLRAIADLHRTLARTEQALREALADNTALRSWHDTAARSIERLGALIEDIRVGAEQQSQSHADVLAKIRQFRGEERI